MAGRFTIRPSGRGDHQPWFHLGQIAVTTTVLVTLLAAASIFVYAAVPSVVEHAALFPPLVRDGEIWRLATWPLANVASLGTVIAIAMFWYFGSQIEDLLRRRRFACYLGTLVLLPALVATAVGLSTGDATFAAGIDVLSLCMFVAFAIEYPSARFFFGIPSWVLAAVYVGIDYLQLIAARNGTGLIVFSSSMLVVAMGLRSFGLCAPFPWLPALPFLRTLAEGRRGRPAARSSSGSSSGSSGSSARRMPRPGRGAGGPSAPKPSRSSKSTPTDRPTVVQGPWGGKPLDQRELDKLLDKIAASGIESLTSDERQALDEASRRLRERRDS